MNSRNKWIIGGSALLVGVATGIFINRHYKEKEEQEIYDILNAKIADPNAGGSQVIISQTEAAKLPDGTFPLKRGDKNKKVLALQQALNRAYGTTISLDGQFGKETYDILCSKYFTFCSPLPVDSLSLSRTVSASEYEEINSKKSTTS